MKADLLMKADLPGGNRNTCSLHHVRMPKVLEALEHVDGNKGSNSEYSLAKKMWDYRKDESDGQSGAQVLFSWLAKYVDGNIKKLPQAFRFLDAGYCNNSPIGCMFLEDFSEFDKFLSGLLEIANKTWDSCGYRAYRAGLLDYFRKPHSPGGSRGGHTLGYIIFKEEVNPAIKKLFIDFLVIDLEVEPGSDEMMGLFYIEEVAEEKGQVEEVAEEKGQGQGVLGQLFEVVIPQVSGFFEALWSSEEESEEEESAAKVEMASSHP